MVSLQTKMTPWKRWPRKLLAISSLFFLVSCAARQPAYPVGVIPPAKAPTVDEEQYGQKVLQELTQRYPLDYSHPRLGEVQQVVDRLAKAANAQGSPWQVYLLKDPSLKNAAATRGNHIFVWTGMLDFAKDEGELASVLAHEMSHVLAGHTGPDPDEELARLLITIGAAVAGTAASIAIGNPHASNIVGQLASDSTTQLGSAVAIYPNSRSRELEADRIGIFLMADAGYDPDDAVKLWTRAQSDPDFDSIPFLSTHPGAADRLVQLRELSTQARVRYEQKKLGIASAPPSAPTTKFASSNSTSSPPGSMTLDREPVMRASSAISAVLKPARCVTAWSVKSDGAIVYEEPDVLSKKRGELKRGATVCAVSNRDGWIRINDPDSGYIGAGDLTLE